MTFFQKCNIILKSKGVSVANIKFFVRNYRNLYDPHLVELQKDVYCRGELLHTIQMHNVYLDSKAYVDKKMKFDPEQILDNFRVLKSNTTKFTQEILEKFMDQNFENEHGFEIHIPPDWGPYPEFINNIQNPYMQQFALDIHNLWKTLGRRVNEDIRSNFSRYSLLYTAKPFIIPGGRFREYYYWDSYWIIRGLTLSEMHETARNMIENYLGLVENFGIIPNGGRIYYTDRSQPPMLTKIIDTYVKVTQDVEFLFNSIPILEKEYFFWVNNRSVQITKGTNEYTMFHYGSAERTPRPESYREDYEAARKLPEDKREKFYNEIRAAAESGIDFSGRWWVPSWKDNPPFTDINTTAIIPVDLNSYLAMNARLLAKFYKMIGVNYKYDFFIKQAELLQEAIMEILWHDDLGTWLDYDHINKLRREKFYPTNLAPLWAECFPKDNNELGEKIVKYLQKLQINEYRGGIPGSLEATGQQWDLPNAWAPQQDIVISGLLNLSNPEAQKLGRELAENWIAHNFISYKQDHVMYEKYNTSMLHTGGGGGEYENQIGFGWTNGVILDFLNRFHDYKFEMT